MSNKEMILFAMPGNEKLTSALSSRLQIDIGSVIIRKFPDGESYIRFHSDVKNKKVIIVSTLDKPDEKLLPLYFLCRTATHLGAKDICLVSPYLAYMRQDKQFHAGEGITSEYFASLISQFAQMLITVDPHLHRRTSLSEIYGIPTAVVHAADLISEWIKEYVKNPVVIGPDSESKQWVSQVAANAGAPYLVLEKNRRGDSDVEIAVPNIENFRSHTPVLVDDIISTAGTMIEAIRGLGNADMKPAVCIGIHPVFAGDAYVALKKSGVVDVITCNTIEHESNRIDVTELLGEVFLKDVIRNKTL